MKTKNKAAEIKKADFAMKTRNENSPTKNQAAFPGVRSPLVSGWSALERLYGRLPKLPFLDKETSSILLISVFIYFLFVAGVYVTSPSKQLHAILTENPISKNAQLSLRPGEHYAYSVSAAGSSDSLQYDVLSPSSCKGSLVRESSSHGQQNQVCLTASGNLEGDPYQLNFSLGNQSLLLFSPWMLALSDRFSWVVQTTFSTGTSEIKMPISFKSNGLREVAGRKAYEIMVDSGISQPARYYIDSDKRILLYADYGNASAKLVSAPFPLNWENSSITFSN